MLFIRVLLFFTLVAFTTAAPTGTVWVPGLPQPKPRPPCPERMCRTFHSWPKANPTDEEPLELTTGYWYSDTVSKHCFLFSPRMDLIYLHRSVRGNHVVM